MSEMITKDFLDVMIESNGYKTKEDFFLTKQQEQESGVKSLFPSFNNSAPTQKEYNYNVGNVSFSHKAYTSNTNTTYEFNNSVNAGVPTLSYVYLAGALYTPYLNIATIANLYSMCEQVVPLGDAVDTISNAAARIQTTFNKTIIKTKNNKKTMESEIYNPLLENDNTAKKNTGVLNDKQYLNNIYDVVQNPNPFIQKHLKTFVYAFCYEMLVTGNAFVIKEYENNTDIETLRLCENVKTLSIRVARTLEINQSGIFNLEKNQENGVINLPVWRELRYIYGSGTSIDYDNIFIDVLGNIRQVAIKGDKVYEIFHINGGVGNTYVGLSKIFRCLQFIQIHYFGALFIRSYFQNSGSPAAILSVKATDGVYSNLSTEQKQEMANFLRDEIKGVSNAGKMLMWNYPNYELVYTPVSASVKEADVMSQLDYAAHQIYDTYNISSSLKQRSGDKYNILQEEIRFYKEAVFPISDLFIDALNEMFIKRNIYAHTNQYFFNNDKNSIEEFREKEIEDLRKAMPNIPLLKINEARSVLDYPSIGPEGDVIPIPRTFGTVEGGTLNIDENNYEVDEMA